MGRGLPLAAGGDTSWRQTLLYPPDLVQLRMDVGWLREERRGMCAIEAYVPHTRELLALEVHRLGLYPSLRTFLEHAGEWQTEVLVSLFDPDPF